MGQHKYNPTVIAAKNEELPPKPKKKSKRECERELYAMIAEKLFTTTVSHKTRQTVMVDGVECKAPRKSC